ncbi:hypothetical protein [Kitasatospora sp. KL5]|uniref:hypothetical protein n=1 Tax=Kitasatospora sp. KL5 TaxID=3425125 RepID=UPI003D6DC966
MNEHIASVGAANSELEEGIGSALRTALEQAMEIARRISESRRQLLEGSAAGPGASLAVERIRAERESAEALFGAVYEERFWQHLSVERISLTVRAAEEWRGSDIRAAAVLGHVEERLSAGTGVRLPLPPGESPDLSAALPGGPGLPPVAGGLDDRWWRDASPAETAAVWDAADRLPAGPQRDAVQSALRDGLFRHHGYDIPPGTPGTAVRELLDEAAGLSAADRALPAGRPDAERGGDGRSGAERSEAERSEAERSRAERSETERSGAGGGGERSAVGAGLSLEAAQLKQHGRDAEAEAHGLKVRRQSITEEADRLALDGDADPDRLAALRAEADRLKGLETRYTTVAREDRADYLRRDEEDHRTPSAGHDRDNGRDPAGRPQSGPGPAPGRTPGAGPAGEGAAAAATARQNRREVSEAVRLNRSSFPHRPEAAVRGNAAPAAVRTPSQHVAPPVVRRGAAPARQGGRG